MVERNSHVATLRNGTTAASANEESFPKPCEARLHLLIHVHVPVHMHVGVILIHVWPYHVHAKTQISAVWEMI